MQFYPSQQKCILLQAITKHASIILQVHKHTKTDNLIV